MPNYTIFVVNKELDVIDYNPNNNIIIGHEIDKKEPLKILLDINMCIIKNNVKRYKE